VVDVDHANAVKERYSARFLSMPGISGIGVEHDAVLGPHIVIHVDERREELPESLPNELEGVPVRVVADGPFRAFAPEP
jgi:hypothetical protein